MVELNPRPGVAAADATPPPVIPRAGSVADALGGKGLPAVGARDICSTIVHLGRRRLLGPALGGLGLKPMVAGHRAKGGPAMEVPPPLELPPAAVADAGRPLAAGAGHFSYPSTSTLYQVEQKKSRGGFPADDGRRPKPDQAEGCVPHHGNLKGSGGDDS